MTFVWDTAKWDQAEWGGRPPGWPGWGDDWAWWYQIGQNGIGGNINLLNPYIVEARWTTDSHTLGDGCFRGDLQPGTVTIRLWDPLKRLAYMSNKAGAVFALYKPTGAAWCWFFESLTKGLYAPGDPLDADLVWTGTTWPFRFTAPITLNGMAAQPADSRLTTIVNRLNNNRGNLQIPVTSGAIAAQSQMVAANQADQNGLFPSWLQEVRNAAPNGVAWLAPGPDTTPPQVGGGTAGHGTLLLTYARWDAAAQRTLDRSQIIAGPAVSAGIDWLVTMAAWQAVNAGGATTALRVTGTALANIWGMQGPDQMRLWGDVTATTGAEYAATLATGNALMAARSDSTEQVLDTITVQSGVRTRPDGRPGLAAWDPYSHHWLPTDVAVIPPPPGAPPAPTITSLFRVVKSEHRLTATIWETTHTIEKYVSAQPLPA